MAWGMYEGHIHIICHLQPTVHQFRCLIPGVVPSRMLYETLANFFCLLEFILKKCCRRSLIFTAFLSNDLWLYREVFWEKILFKSQGLNFSVSLTKTKNEHH